MKLSTPIAVIATTLAAVPLFAAQPVAPWVEGKRPFTLADMGFTADAHDEYVESINFVAELQGGTRVEIQLVVTNLGAGKNNAGIKSTIIAGGKTRRFSVEIDNNWTQAPGTIDMGKTRVAGDLDQIRLVHESDDYTADLTFKRKTPAWRPRSGKTVFGSGDSKRFYEFALLMPVARVSGKLRLGPKTFDVRGAGYVDHSRANLYSHRQATRWYRLRGVSDGVLVQMTQFITSAKYGSKPVGWLVVFDGNRVLHESFDFRLDVANRKPDKQRPEYKVPWRYELTAPGLRGSADAKKLLLRTDFLASMGMLKRLIVSQFAKPVGLTLAGNFTLSLELPAGERRFAGRAKMTQTFIK